jgi:hypothetical protein
VRMIVVIAASLPQQLFCDITANIDLWIIRSHLRVSLWREVPTALARGSLLSTLPLEPNHG